MNALFCTMLTGLYALMRFGVWRNPEYRAQLAQHDVIAQIRLIDSDLSLIHI